MTTHGGGYCSYCGTWNAATSTKCSGCGGGLPWAMPPAPQAAQAKVTAPKAAPPHNARGSLRKLAGDLVSGQTGVEVARGLHVASDAISLLIFAPIFLLLAGVLIWAAASGKLPWHITLIVLGVVGLVVVLQVATIFRMASARLQPSARPAQAAGASQVSPDEKIRLSVAGILWAGWRTSALGVGRTKCAHNALIVTDRHILLLVIPTPGAGQIVGGTDYGLWQWMAAKDELQAQLDAMLSSMSLAQIVRSDSENLALPTFGLHVKPPRRLIGKVSGAAFTFITPDGQERRYHLRDAQDIDALRAVLGV